MHKYECVIFKVVQICRKKSRSLSYDCTHGFIAVKMVPVAPSSEDEKYVNKMSPATTRLLSSAAARSYPVSLPGRYGRY